MRISWSAAPKNGSRQLTSPRNIADTVVFTSKACCRPTRAATSTSADGRQDPGELKNKHHGGNTMLRRMLLISAAALVGAGMSAGTSALAQENYPTRPITL